MSGDLICQGDLDRLDPIASLARFALSSRGGHSRAIEWLEGDIQRHETSKVSEKKKSEAISDLKQAIAWLRHDQRKAGAA